VTQGRKDTVAQPWRELVLRDDFAILMPPFERQEPREPTLYAITG
jgi:hypothetical protein